MPLIICQINFFFKRTITTQLMMFLNVIMMSRFFYIFVLRNPTAFQDEFWSFFGNIWILFFSWTGQMASEIMLGCENINVNICSGVNRNIPDDCQKGTRNDRFNGIVSIFSFLIHSFVLIKIQIFKWKKPARPNLLKVTKLAWRNFLETNFCSNVILTAVNCFTLVIMFIMPYVVRKLMYVENSEKVHIMFDIYYRLVRVPLTILLLLLLLLANNSALRILVTKEILKMVCRIKEIFLV